MLYNNTIEEPRSMRSTAERQNIGGMRSLFRFKIYVFPWSSMAFATFIKPAIFAPYE
jgi:hypothetical protein